MANPPRPIDRVALVAVVLVLGTVLLVAWMHPWAHGDSRGLSGYAARVEQCLQQLNLIDCDRVPPQNLQVSGAVHPFPLLQYVPAVSLRAVGLSRDGALRWLIVIDALALIGIVAIAWFVAARCCGMPWPPVLVMTIIVSPLLWFGVAGFGEALAAFVVVAAIAAVALNLRPSFVAVLVAIACTSKESHPPFVFALAALTALAVVPRGLPRKRMMIGIVVGSAAGIGINAAFNVFRFGAVQNIEYLQQNHIPDLVNGARVYAALVASPNGGIIWWWPTAIGLLTLLAIGAWTTRTPEERRPRMALAGWAVVALLAIDFVGLAAWYTPFGGVTWGPRLSLPLIPGMLLASTVACAPRATPLLVHLLRRAWFWIVATVAILLAVPQMTALFVRPPFGNYFTGNECPNRGRPLSNYARHYNCVVHRAWGERPMLLHSLQGLRSYSGAFAVVCFVVAAIALLLSARASGTQAAGATQTRPWGTT